ncbi:MAG: hypothetical protein U0R66_12185 [Mycobacterium sp.]
MSKVAILTAISGALVAGSLALAGPAFAHPGDAGHGSATPAGGASTSPRASDTENVRCTDGTPCVGIGIFTAPAAATGPSSVTPGITSHAAVGAELPFQPIGAAPAA